MTPTTGDPDAPAPAGTPTHSVRVMTRRLLQMPWARTFGLLAILVVFFAVAAPDRFASVNNVRNIAIDTSGLLILAVGMTFVIIVAGIDLSMGAVLVFSGVVGAKAMEATAGTGFEIWIGLVVTLASGLAWGVVNGVLVAKAGLPPLIVTLGTLSMALGLAYVISGGFDLRGIPKELSEVLGQGRLFDVLPLTVVVAATVAIGGALLLSETRFGRYTLAIGSNREAARRVGIQVDRHLVRVYALSGLLAGLAGYLNLARFQTTTISGHSNDILQAITAVALGGTSLFGGVGTVVGSVIGAFIPAVLRNGMVIFGIQPFWQQVIVGGLLISVVYADHLARRARDRL